MKNFLIAMAALMTLAFIGCGKDEEPANDALVGTTWTSSYGDSTLTLNFNKGGAVTLKMDTDVYTGVYSYNAPNVAIQIPITGRNVTFTGTCSNGSLNLSNETYGTFVFTQSSGQAPDNSGNTEKPNNQSEMKYVKTATIHTVYATYTISAKYDDQNRMVAIYENSDWAGSFSYGDNLISVEEPGQQNQKYTLKLTDNGYVKTLTDIASDITIEHTYEDGYLVKRTGDGQTETYTWQNGNMVAAEYSGRSAYSIKLTYDESVVMKPMNVDILYLFDIVRPIYDDYEAVVYLGIWGRQCKNPLTKVEYEYGASAFSYEFNSDNSISKISTVRDGIAITVDFEYL